MNQPGDLAGDNETPPATFAAVSEDVEHHRRELAQAIRHRTVFFYLAIGTVVVFFAVLLCLIYHGPASLDAYKVYVTELGIVAVIPSAILLRLASMVAGKGEVRKAGAETEIPLPSTTVVREVMRAMVEMVKESGPR